MAIVDAGVPVERRIFVEVSNQGANSSQPSSLVQETGQVFSGKSTRFERAGDLGEQKGDPEKCDKMLCSGIRFEAEQC